MVQTTRKRFPVFVFCFVFLVVLALCERGFTFAWPPPSPFAPSNTGIHFSQRAYNKYHHHLPGCPPGLSAFHSWTVARAVSSFISLKTETRKIDVFCSESSPFLLCAVKIIQTISKSEIWRGPICQNISVHNTVLQVQPSLHVNKKTKKKKKQICVVSKQRGMLRRGECVWGISTRARLQTPGLMNVRRRSAENPRHPWINGQVIYDIRPWSKRLHLSFSPASFPHNLRLIAVI